MTIGAIVQARMSSSRMPGKVLRSLRGKPMLAYLTERLKRCPELDAVVVATSTGRDDDPIQAFCEATGVLCHRGPLENVAARFSEVLHRFGWDAFVRVSGDSPLLDTALVSQALRLFYEETPDLVTNVLVRTFPKGQSVEVVSADAFRRAYAQMSEPEEFEHVTPHFYRHPKSFRIVDFRSDADYGEVQLSVDMPADFDVVERLIEQMKRPHWDYSLAEILQLHQAVADK